MDGDTATAVKEVEETEAKVEEEAQQVKKDEIKEEDIMADDEAVKTEKNEATTTATDAPKTKEPAVVADAAETDTPPPPTNFQKIPSVGFLAQGWSGGVYHPHCLQNTPDWSCGLADLFNNEFLPTSPIPPYDSKCHRGIWRTVTLRCSLRTRECMVIVLHAPSKGGAGKREDGQDDYSEVFEGEKNRMVEILTRGVIPMPKREFPEDHVDEHVDDDGGSEENGEEGGIRVTSIFFQEYEGLSNPKPDHPVQVSFIMLFFVCNNQPIIEAPHI